jgi:hypothetical protein
LHEDGIKQFRRYTTMLERLEFVHRWVCAEDIEILIIDTVNDFFRGRNETPNDEVAVGMFFDRLRTFSLQGYVLVRHDHKPKMEDSLSGNSNDRIRGSSEWKEDPEVIVSLHRKDKRTNEVELEIGKQRYGPKRPPLNLWLDAGTLTLTPLPPVIAMLEKGPRERPQLVADAKLRFGLGQRGVDGQLDLYRCFLREQQRGHCKVFEICWDAIPLTDDEDPDSEWRRLLVSPEG